MENIKITTQEKIKNTIKMHHIFLWLLKDEEKHWERFVYWRNFYKDKQLSLLCRTELSLNQLRGGGRLSHYSEKELCGN